MAKRKSGNKKTAGKAGHGSFSIVVHPFLAAVYPVIFLLAYNIKETYVGGALAPVIVSLAAAAAVFFTLNFFLKDSLKTGIITTVSVLAFFSYGHIHRLLKEAEIGDFQVFNHPVLLVLVVMLAYLAADALIKTGKLKQINFILNVVAGLMTALVAGQAVYGMAVYHKKAYDTFNKRVSNTAQNARKNSPDELKKYPDIYYIILDGYGRMDMLEQVSGYDGSDFVNFLKGRGFYVADRSRSNYCQTFLSLASSYNMEYLDRVAGKNESGDIARVYLGEMIRRNKVIELLKERGYAYVSYFTGFVGTELKRIADVYLPKEDAFEAEMSEFDAMLLDSTMLYGFQGILNMSGFKKTGTHLAYVRRTQYILENLDKSAEIASPKIVFAHIITPHPPFVFDANGPTDKYVGTKGVDFAAGDQNALPRDEYRKAYIGQVEYIGRNMKKTLSRLIAATKGKAIIIVQGDHGPGAQWAVNSFEKTNLKERFSILNAYYLPDGGEKLLYPNITPVNTFRVVFRHYFGMDMPLLPDESFYSTWDEPFKFTKITEAF